MAIAHELAEFVNRQSYEDLPPTAIEYAEMLISSTIASASLGSTIDSAKIIRDVEVERGGKAEATVWFGAAGAMRRLPTIVTFVTLFITVPP